MYQNGHTRDKMENRSFGGLADDVAGLLVAPESTARVQARCRAEVGGSGSCRTRRSTCLVSHEVGCHRGTGCRSGSSGAFVIGIDDLSILPVSNPMRDFARGNQSSRDRWVDRAGVDDQPLVEFGSRKTPGLRLRFKRSGLPRASPPGQNTALVNFKGDIPGEGHRLPQCCIAAAPSWPEVESPG
jgi:hypothetical protein